MLIRLRSAHDASRPGLHQVAEHFDEHRLFHRLNYRPEFDFCIQKCLKLSQPAATLSARGGFPASKRGERKAGASRPTHLGEMRRNLGIAKCPPGLSAFPRSENPCRCCAVLPAVFSLWGRSRMPRTAIRARVGWPPGEIPAPRRPSAAGQIPRPKFRPAPVFLLAEPDRRFDPARR